MTDKQKQEIESIKKNLASLEEDFKRTGAPHIEELITKEKEYLAKRTATFEAAPAKK